MHLLFAAMTAVILFSEFIGPAEARTPPRESIEQMVVDEAVRTGIPPSIALAVAKVESNFQPRAVSSAGARGVMQIMPKTGRDLYGVEPDALWDPQTNVRIGVHYLRSLFEQYGGRWDLALSHYNGGSRVGTPPNAKVIPETQGYVDAVLAWQRRFERHDTVLAMNNAIETRDRQIRSIERRMPADWMFDDPTVVKDWRYYLKVADYWLNGKGNKDTGDKVTGGTDIAPAPAANAAAREPAAVPNEPQRPSAELARRFTARRLQFRDQLATGARPWASMRGGFSPYRVADGFSPEG